MDDLERMFGQGVNDLQTIAMQGRRHSRVLLPVLALSKQNAVVAAVEIFGHTVQRAVADGAELVIPAEGVLNELLYASRVHRIRLVPVLDCVGATILHAELIVRMRRTSC